MPSSVNSAPSAVSLPFSSLALRARFFPFVAIGVREFTDETVPSSAAVSGGVVYVVQAQRGELYGDESLPFVVTFGIGGGGSLAILNAYIGTGETAKKKAA